MSKHNLPPIPPDWPPGHYHPNHFQFIYDGSHIFRRPGMYIGSTDQDGIVRLMYEVLACLEHQCPYPRTTLIELHLIAPDVLHLRADAQGFTIDESFSLPIVGLGLFILRALSLWLEIDLHQRGECRRLRAQEGEIVEPLTTLGPTDWTGVEMRFQLDPLVFPEPRFPIDLLLAELRQRSYFAPGLCLTLDEYRFHHPDGYRQLWLWHAQSHEWIADSIEEHTWTFAQGTIHAVVGKLTECQCQPVAYVNRNQQPEGSALTGIEDAWRTADPPRRHTVGVLVLLVIDHDSPEWDGSTRGRLRCEETYNAIRGNLQHVFTRWTAQSA